MNWDEVLEGHPGDRWLIATENGMGALTAWAAGTDNVRKMAVDDTGRTVNVECREPGGTTRAWTEAFSVADREIVDESAESYLADARVPLPPRGWVWLIRRPATFNDDRKFWGYLNQQIVRQASPALHPRELAPILKRTMAELYSDQSATEEPRL